jgi:hypothetical protein
VEFRIVSSWRRSSNSTNIQTRTCGKWSKIKLSLGSVLEFIILTNFALTTKLPTLLVSNWSIGFLALAALTKFISKLSKLLAKKDAEEFTNPSILDLAKPGFFSCNVKNILSFNVF